MYSVQIGVVSLPKTNLRPVAHESERAPSTWDNLFEQDARIGLNRERIVAAGIALADQHGLAALSIRRIAAQLGSSTMALYHHVLSKRDLMNLLLDALNAEFQWPSQSFPHWRATLSHFARESRRSLKRHPWASALHAGDCEYGPQCIRTLEYLLRTLSEFGLDMRSATRALGVLFVFVNGFVAAEGAEAGSRPSKTRRSSTNRPRFSRAVLATGKFPKVAQFASMDAELPDDDGFERALNWILDGIAADLSAHAELEAPKRRVASQKGGAS